MTDHTVVLDKSIPQHPRLIIDVPPEQQAAIEEILAKLERARGKASTQTIVLDALRTAVEQSYFWTPAWQAKEQEVDRALAEGRARTFDSMEDMLDFLERQ